MTNHSLDELKRQMDDAKSRLNKALIDALAAEKRYHDARVKETGLLNKVMTSSKYAILVTDIEFFGSNPWRATGFRIKADGTAGFSSGYVYFNTPHDISPYAHEAASSQALTPSKEKVETAS